VFLGIEIGGTKLQLGVGRGDGELLALERHAVTVGIGGGFVVDGEIDGTERPAIAEGVVVHGALALCRDGYTPKRYHRVEVISRC
jgi:predicted NBD/HSP70 family sugar kinase